MKMSNILEFKKYYFTFGCGQKHENCYVKIEAKNHSEARTEMCNRFGIKWSMQYTEKQWLNEKGISQAEEYNLAEIKSEDEEKTTFKDKLDSLKGTTKTYIIFYKFFNTENNRDGVGIMSNLQIIRKKNENLDMQELGKCVQEQVIKREDMGEKSTIIITNIINQKEI